MRQFPFFFILLIPAMLSSQTETGSSDIRCQYHPSREFLLSRNDSCYQITSKEADRAFALRCWDEAMALYRAAKSCADANQTARSQMNRRIQACRDSSEQELRRSEQQARRQFLHATAANLADDAEERLKQYDRSFAYRLADFAGQYIAPGPNADCINTMLEAWYYVPPVQPGTVGYKDLQVPFCYQLDYDLGGNVQARFGGKGKYRRLYVYAPASRQLLSWDAEMMKPGKGMVVEEGLPYFDISPDGWTLMFFSEKNILFWRSSSETSRVTASKISRYCFSPSGDEFLYYDEKESKIYILHMRDVYAQRKGGQRPGAQALIQNVPYEVLGMAYYNGRIWLGGRDSLVVLQKGESETQWNPVAAIPWNLNQISETADLKIWPDRGTAFFIQHDNAAGIARRPDSLNNIIRVPLNLKDGLPVSAGAGLPLRGTPLAIRQDASLVALSDSDRDLMYLLTTDDGAMRHGMFLQPEDRFNPMSGSISPDGRWMAAATDTGTLKLWALTELRNDSITSLPGEIHPVFSQNEDYFSRYSDKSLQICATEQPGTPIFSVPDISENTLVVATGKNRVAYYTDGNSLTVKSGTPSQTREFPVDDGTEPMAAFDENENLIAYTVRADSLVIRSLETGEVVAGRSINGSVSILKFIPRQEAVLLIQNDPSQSYLENQIIAKVWSFNSAAGERSQSIRLHGYSIYLAAVSSSGDQVAFTDGKDIRVFHLDNLLDESARIRPNERQFVTALAFHPDGTALVASYNDGMIIVWDLKTGESRFRLQTQDDWIENLSFSQDGGRLRIKTTEGSLFFRTIDPAVIRATAQTEYLRLLAFTPEQIQSKGLEKALDYSGNFQRLAESRDLPLIRSFFEYYRQQALASNNIGQVRSYFSSASRLYSKLDDPVTQRVLRSTMYEIYEDYIWKLLLREKNDEATRVVNEFYRVFDKPLPAFESGAYASLLRNDFSAAAKQYAEWTIRMYENPAVQPYFWSVLDSVQQKFRQLSEYNLLSQPQKECICNVYSKILDIRYLCGKNSDIASVPFDAETRLRWNIFQNTYISSGTYNHLEKVRLLEAAFADAKTLYRRNAATWRNQLERSTLELARAYTEQGVFEQGNVLSAARYQQALRLLDTFGRFKSDEPARLKALIKNDLNLGDYFLSTNRFAEAARQFESGLHVAKEMLESAPADSLPEYRNDHLAPLWTEMGMAQLLQGKTHEADSSFHQAFDAYTYGLYTYFFGHIALMENNEPEALNRYREIYSAQQLGSVLFVIDRLAGLFPQKKARLDAFASTMRKTVLDAHPEISSDETDYAFSVDKGVYASANGLWAEALAWNEKGLVAAKRLAGQPESSEEAKSHLLDAMLSKSFYLLYTGQADPGAYNKVIATVDTAEAYLKTNNFYYQYHDWLLTNLAHAYLLRNKPGDREEAIKHYTTFVGMIGYGQDHWELLQKDFRDLHRAGIRWPNLKEVIMAIKPDNIELTGKDWEDMGVEMTATGG